MKIIAIALFGIIGLAALIAGRVMTFHMTEGEALVQGSPFWILTILIVFLCVLIWREL